MKADETKTSSHAEVAEVLAEFFGSVCELKKIH